MHPETVSLFKIRLDSSGDAIKRAIIGDRESYRQILQRKTDDIVRDTEVADNSPKRAMLKQHKQLT
jgi:hypothetical protein